ncbi:hypothetical protein DFH09DRAFT_1326066 [Mycena vulgaris]|nr:hypothetical protein DFH09DRAFT_1326066 [Mycena vulgaris]
MTRQPLRQSDREDGIVIGVGFVIDDRTLELTSQLFDPWGAFFIHLSSLHERDFPVTSEMLHYVYCGKRTG